MFSPQRVLVTMDGFEYSIGIKAAEYLPSCDLLSESRIYTADYDGPITTNMIEPIIMEMHTGFSGKYLGESRTFWAYHRLFLHKYISHEVTKKMTQHPMAVNTRIKIQDLNEESSRYHQFLLDMLTNINDLAGIHFRCRDVDQQLYLDRRPAIYADRCQDRKLLQSLLTVYHGRHPFELYKEQIETPEFLMDRDIFGL